MIWQAEIDHNTDFETNIRILPKSNADKKLAVTIEGKIF